MHKKIFYIKMRHMVNNVVYKTPILACNYQDALEKANEYPYNTFGDYVIIKEELEKDHVQD